MGIIIVQLCDMSAKNIFIIILKIIEYNLSFYFVISPIEDKMFLLHLVVPMNLLWKKLLQKNIFSFCRMARIF